MADLGQLIVQIEGRTDRLEKAFTRAKSISDRRFGEIDRRAKTGATTIETAFGRTATSITQGASAATAAMLRMGSAIGVALSIREVLSAANSWKEYENKVKAAGTPIEKLDTIMSRLTDTAMRTRTDLGVTVDMFSKLTLVSEQYGLSADQAIQITETVSKSLKAAGSSASETASTITQLSQALASGTLAGDELKSLRENAPLLLKAIAKELGTTTGKLKEMGAEGQLSSDKIIRALLGASDEIDRAFRSTVPTVQDASQKVGTAFTALVGTLDKSTGSSEKLAKALDGIANKLDHVREVSPGWTAAIIEGAEKALEKLSPLEKTLAKMWSRSKLGFTIEALNTGKVEDALNKLVTERDRGLAMLRQGMGTKLSTDVDELYGVTKPIKSPTSSASKSGGGGSDLFEQIQRRTEALRLEADMWGKSTVEVERARVAQELLSRAKADGVPINASLRQKIDQAADAYARETQRLEALQRAQEILNELKSNASDFASSFIKDIASGTSAVDALGSALDRLRDKLIELASQKIFDALLGSTTGGVGNVLSSLLGGHASGGYISGPGSGKSDSIVTRVSNGEFVVNADATAQHRDLLEAINSGQSLKIPTTSEQVIAPQTNIHQTFAPTIQVSGGTNDQNVDMADRMEAKLKEMFREFYNQETIRNLRYGGLFRR